MFLVWHFRIWILMSQNNLVKWVLVSIIYKGGDWGLEGLTKLFWVTQPGNRREGLNPCVCKGKKQKKQKRKNKTYSLLCLPYSPYPITILPHSDTRGVGFPYTHQYWDTIRVSHNFTPSWWHRPGHTIRSHELSKGWQMTKIKQFSDKFDVLYALESNP